MTLAATPSLIQAKLADLLRVDSGLRVVALHADASWSHRVEVDLPAGRRAHVRACASTLAVRDALTSLSSLPDSDVLVLLTPLDSATLGESITSRLAAQRVLPIDRWQQLQTLFAARAIDPRLPELGWAVDALLAEAPVDGYTPVSGGYLDRDTALATLADAAAGLTPLDLDLGGLLLWSLDPTHSTRWQSLTPPVRAGLTQWLASRGNSEVTSAVLQCLAHPTYGFDTLALGLVFGALTGDGAERRAETFAAVLATRIFGGALAPAVAGGWGQAAETVAQRLWLEDPQTAAAVCAQAEKLLVADAGAPVELAGASPVLPAGLDQRLTSLAERIVELLRRRSSTLAHLQPVEAALAQVLRHAVAGQHEERARRATMAVRLTRWLIRQRVAPAPPATGLAAAARRQEIDDAFVDVARARVWEGEVAPPVADAYAALCRAVDELRAEHEHRFAVLLRDWTANADPAPDLLPVEHVIDDVVLPLANGGQRLLLIVLDGMSTAVARELLADLTPSGWVEHGLQPARPVLSVLPSVTRVSRTSMLSGRLVDGTAAAEKTAFAERGWPLFHKGDLTTAAAGSVFTDVVTAAVNGTSPVVGAVVNTVDDTLAKGGRSPWLVASVDRLAGLLQLAAEAGRVVLLVSDHGHVHERGSRLETDDTGGTRWRVPGSGAGDDEVELSGPRVLLGGGRIVGAWNERLRYGPKANGYHGGASAQEVVIPLALLARGPLHVEGWHPRYHPEPDWWVESSTPAAATPPAGRAGPRKAPPRAPQTPPAEDGLFSTDEVSADAWIALVLDSPVLTGQLSRVRRMGVQRPQVETLLRVLSARGGSAPRAVVARALDTPDFRMNGLLATMARVLNIDGYEVLAAIGDTVTLNVAMLKTQAGLE